MSRLSSASGLYRVMKGETYQTLHSAIFSSPTLFPLSDTRIFLATLVSNTLDIYYFLTGRNQIPHSYKTAKKIMIFNVYINLDVLHSIRGDKGFWTASYIAVPKYLLLLISSWMQFFPVDVSKNHINLSQFWKHLFISILRLCPKFYHPDMNITWT